MSFELHPSLAKKDFILDLTLCQVLLHDDVNYRWMILVPRRPNVSRMMDLQSSDQMQLMIELDHAQQVLWHKYRPTQLNVAAIGNKTPQLHLHVIARNSHDPAWPGTVWDHPLKQPYPTGQKQQVIQEIKEAFEHILLPLSQ